MYQPFGGLMQIDSEPLRRAWRRSRPSAGRAGVALPYRLASSRTKGIGWAKP